MTALLRYDAACQAVDSPAIVRSVLSEAVMRKKPDAIHRIRALSEAINEVGFLHMILRYAQAGHGTPLIVEQAIVITDKLIAECASDNDDATARSARAIKAGLQQALIDGVGSLRVKRGPGPEVTEVEAPLAVLRIAQAHNLERQRKCAGGTIDIFDITANQIIECKHRGTSAALGEAVGQLRRYSRSFPDAELAIAVLTVEPEAEWLADVLRRQGIVIIVVGPSR